jgi:uncharacterized membrane protein
MVEDCATMRLALLSAAFWLEADGAIVPDE